MLQVKHVIKVLRGLDLEVKVTVTKEGFYKLRLNSSEYIMNDTADVRDTITREGAYLIRLTLDKTSLTDDQIKLLAVEGVEAAFEGYKVKKVKPVQYIKNAALWLDPHKHEWDHDIEVAVAAFDTQLLCTCSPSDDSNWTYINERVEDFLEDLFYCSAIPDQYAILSYNGKVLFLADKEAKTVTYNNVDYVIQKPLSEDVAKWVNERILHHLVKIEKYLKVKEVIAMTPLYPLWEKRSTLLINTLLPSNYLEKVVIEDGDRNEACKYLMQEYRLIGERLKNSKRELYEKAMLTIAQKFNDDVKSLNAYIDGL